ncbi:MAG TPA: hypothetical protein GX731_02040 [Clostridiales bacterium]|nr:hypothetical protein [Clostridiales bacterium]
MENVNTQKSQKSISRKGESKLPITVDYSSRLDQEIKAVDYAQDKEAGAYKSPSGLHSRKLRNYSDNL